MWGRTTKASAIRSCPETGGNVMVFRTSDGKLTVAGGPSQTGGRPGS